jgi:hypothetical protein
MNYLDQHNASGAIIGNNPAIDNSKTANQLGNFLDTSFRRSTTGTVTDIYINNDTGDNDNDGLSPSTAFADLYRATQIIGEFYADRITVHLANTGTKYTAAGLQNLQNVFFEGEVLELESRNITSVTASNNNEGCIFVVDGATLTNDEWAGRILWLRGTQGDNFYINVDGNVGNTIYGATHNRFFGNDSQVSPAGGTVSLLSMPEVDVANGSVFSESTDCSFRYVNFTGGQVFVTAGGKFEWFSSMLGNTSISAGLGGGVVGVFNCAVAMTGAGAGFLLARRGGVLRVGSGTTFSTKALSSPSRNIIDVAQDSQIVFQRGCILNGCKFEFDGANSFITNQNGLKVVNRVVGGTPTVDTTYTMNNAATGLGFGYLLPNTQGEISGDYLVEATRGANVELASGTSVVTAIGTNTVSADGGATLSSRNADGTRIVGGSPEFYAGFKQPLRITSSTTLDGSAEVIFCDTDGGAITTTLPPGVAGTTYKIINCGSSGNDVTVTPDGSELLVGSNSSETLADGDALIITYEVTEGWW